MSTPLGEPLSRRAFLTGGGLVLAFSLAGAGSVLAQGSGEDQGGGQKPVAAPELPGSLKKAPMLDSWIRVDPEGGVTVFTGKAELGQGIKTALAQIAAEQLDVAAENVQVVTADTARTADEGFTAGSHSLQDSGTAVLHAAAQVRAILVGLAAERLGVPADQLRTEAGAVVAPDGQTIGFGAIVSTEALHVRAAPTSPLKDPGSFKVMGQPVRRIDIPAKVTGGPAYVQDLRLPGMVHGRVVRPPSYGARLRSVDTAAVERLPGVLKIVRDGNYLAVLAQREFQAVVAGALVGRRRQVGRSRGLAGPE